jgi:calpain, invertebrate
LYGDWVDVVIDDRLPINAKTNKLAFIRSTEKNEFWSALLEKAYAKFYGGYDKLRGGNACEGMEDLTGGIAEAYHLKDPPYNLYKIMLKAFEKGSLLSCGIDSDENSRENITPQGLVTGHAYSITKVQTPIIKTLRKSGPIEMIRLRNPWGGDVEWNGAFSDKSREWQVVQEKEIHDLNFDHDGEFWMTYLDFRKYFDTLEVCSVIQNYILCDEEEKSETWYSKEAHGEWIANKNSGGCRNYISTFHLNPQYIFTLKKADNDTDGKCSILVALLQKNRRRYELKHLAIGFVIYDISHCKSSTIFDKNFLESNISVGRSSSYMDMRGNARRFKFPPGKYLIIPSAFYPNESAEYLLRIVAEGPCELLKAQ